MHSRDDLARRAAGRLHFVATVVLIIVTLFAGIAFVSGFVVVAKSGSHSAERFSGGVLILAGLFGWLFSLMPYVAAQAIARYIEFRVTEAE